MGYVYSAIEHIGLTKLGDRLNYWPSAIQKWQKADRLPRTELMGITNYAEVIEEMTEGKFKAKKLKEHTLKQWQEKVAADRRRA